MTAVYDYDFFVIGGGSGGLAASKRAASLGKRVAVADFIVPSPAGTTWGLGGTCVNVGCIPKKLMHMAAQSASQAQDMHHVGWESKQTHNYENMLTNVNNYIRSLNWGQKSELMSNDIKYYNKYASFIDKNTLKLVGKDGKEETVTADKILIAAGGRPSNGGYEGAELCIDSDDFFWRKKVPGRTLVVGASYIALECAGFIAGLGFDTTVMVRSIFLRGFDQQMANMVASYMEGHGVNFVRQQVPSKFTKADDGQIIVHTKDGVFGKYDTVLLAIGRQGNAGKLNLEAAGVEYESATGKIIGRMDEATNVDNIYAIGDIVKGCPELTPVAIQAGRLLASRLFDNASKKMDYNNVATVVFTPLEYGTCGLSEEAAIEKLGEFAVVYHAYYKPLLWELNDQRDNCFLKIVVDSRTDVIVGMHIVGPSAGEIMPGYAAAMKCGLTKAQLDDTVGIHPTDGEAFTTLFTIKNDDLPDDAGGC